MKRVYIFSLDLGPMDQLMDGSVLIMKRIQIVTIYLCMKDTNTCG